MALKEMYNFCGNASLMVICVVLSHPKKCDHFVKCISDRCSLASPGYRRLSAGRHQEKTLRVVLVGHQIHF